MYLYSGVRSTVHAVVAGICWWVLQHLEQLQAHIADYKQFAVPVVLAGLAILFRMSDALSKVIVEKIPIFSRAFRRILTGDNYIEGDWPLVVVDMEKRVPIYFGVLCIDFKDGQYYIYGNDWQRDGKIVHSFHSKQSLYSNHKLHYWYEQGASMHDPDMRGYTEIFFFPRNGIPERLAGKFLDPRHTGDIRFYSIKKRYRMFEKAPVSKNEILILAQEIWVSLESQMGVLRERSISVDFALMAGPALYNSDAVDKGSKKNSELC